MIKLIPLLIFTILLGSCRKTEKKPVEFVDQVFLKQEILNDLCSNVINPCYSELSENSNQLYLAINDFALNSTQQNLLICREKWKSTRSSWERSEGFLFGPVSTDNIDPRIDSWPINYLLIDNILATSTPLTISYVDNLEDGLKGFHTIEYLLWGVDGTKLATTFSSREKDFLSALALNLKTLCFEAKNSWDPNGVTNFSNQITSAGKGSTLYQTQLQAYEEIINAMIGICDEVAAGKIGETFITLDPSLEESPFSDNSITDFKNNIKSVQYIYLGQYVLDGYGIEDLIKSNNSSMDGQIRLKINTALQSLENITDPFGTAITTQGAQVQNSINSINALKTYLEESVLPFVQTIVQ
jgi:putative iron-regulated protein